jgi:hypothetical protein
MLITFLVKKRPATYNLKVQKWSNDRFLQEGVPSFRFNLSDSPVFNIIINNFSYNIILTTDRHTAVFIILQMSTKLAQT